MPALSQTAPAAVAVNPDPVALLAALRTAHERADAGERAAYQRLYDAEQRLNTAAGAREVAEEALKRAIASNWCVRDCREDAEAAASEARAAAEAIGTARRALETAKAANAEAWAALSGYVPPVTAEDVHEAEGACAQLRSDRQRLEALHAQTVAPPSAPGELQLAQAERRRLLADAAEGKGDPDALAAAEARVSTLEAHAAAHARQCATVAETRAAMRERIEATTAQLLAAERHAKELHRLFWQSLQAEAFGRYLAAALAVRDAWLRAEAADRYARAKGLKSMTGLGWDYMVLPGAAAPIGDSRYVLESSAYLRTEIERACNDLRDALD